MATLENQTIASTYEQLIKLDTETLGADASAKWLETGKAENLPISVSTNRVGIGTTSPSSPLSVESNIADGGVLAHFFDGTMSNTDFFTINIGRSAGNHNCGVLKYSYTADGHTGNYISLGLKSTEDTLCVTSDARVGIGTTGPITALDVHSTGGEVAAAFGMADDGNTFVTTRVLETLNFYGAYAFMVGSAASDGVASTNTTGYIASKVANDISSGETPLEGDLQFYYNTGNSLTLGMILDEDGNVGIGTAAPATQASADVFLEIVKASGIAGLGLQGGSSSRWELTSDTGDDLIMSRNGTARFKIDGATGDSYTNDASLSSLSDVRIKKDITDLTDGLNIVNQLKPRTYKFNGKAAMGIDDDVTRYGFVADEVIEVTSNYTSIGVGMIDGSEVNDLKSLSMTRMIPMLVKAIQELSAKVTALEGEDSSSDTKIAALEAKDVASEASITALEAEDVANKAKVATLETEDVANKAKIVALEAKDTEYATTITALTARITALESA